MIKDEDIEKVRARIHEIVNRNQELLTKVTVIELRLSDHSKDIDEHENAIKKLERFMYIAIGVSAGAHAIIEWLFRVTSGPK